MFKYIFQFFRPKNVEEAARRKLYFSVAYGFLGWNSFMYVFYTLIIKEIPTDPEGRRNALINKLSESGDVKVLRIEGLKVVEDRTVKANSLETEENDKEQLEI